MDQNKLNKIRAIAGLPPSYNREERIHLEEKAKRKQELIEEAANNRPSPKILEDIAKRHLHVKTLKKCGDDEKDYHECPCWAIEAALKAAFKAGQESKVTKPVKEAVDTSTEESRKGGSNPPFDPKGGIKHHKNGKDKVEKKETEEEKKQIAMKKGESSENYKTPKNKTAKDVKEMYYEDEEDYGSSYKKGAHVIYNDEIFVVHVPDAKDNFVGIIPFDKKDDSEEEKDDAVDLVRISKLKPASDEDYEMMCSEESSMGYQNPKGTKLTADPKSGAHEKKGHAYKDVPHKDDSMKAKSEDKGKKDLKKISEEEAVDATVWGKDYGHDDERIDKDENPNLLRASDPNAGLEMKVPAEHKKTLREAIDRLSKEAEKTKSRDPEGSQFYQTTAEAFKVLLDHLEEGTKRSLLLAQVDMAKLMGPMLQRLPNEVYMYIVRGGKPAGLNELFKEIKFKKEGADLSKKAYTS